MQTHVSDVVNTIEAEELRDAVPVGHSYGGMVITGAADRLADRLIHLIVSMPSCRTQERVGQAATPRRPRPRDGT